MYDRILLPTDGSDASDRAVEQAVGLARETGAELHVLFVVEDIPYAPEMMDDTVEEELQGIGEEAIAAIEARADEAGVDVVSAIRKGARSRFLAWLSVTVFLGVAFVGGQIWEYYELLVVEGVPVTTIFFSAFFGLTGLHGLHVSLGVVLLGIVLVRALRGQFDSERHTAVATVSMYWHFVDAVWVFLVVTLYVSAVA